MAPLKTLLLFLVVLLPVANACQPPRTLHVPVFHRDALFPPPPGAKRGSLLRQRLAADAARYASLVDATGRLHSPVFSGIPFESGEYFALVGVGTPSTKAMLVIDTGSDLVWLQCSPCRRCYAQRGQVFDPRRSSTYRRVPCSSPQCRALRFPGCDSGGAAGGGCRYMVAYGDGSSSTGDLATDKLAFANDTYVNNVTLGCGRDNEGLFDSAAGLLGRRAAARYPSRRRWPRRTAPSSSTASATGRRAQRAARTSCSAARRSRRPRRSPPCCRTRGARACTTWTWPGSASAARGSPGSRTPASRWTRRRGRGGVVVDSGTAISRFARDAYAALRDAFDARARAAGMRRLAGEHSVFDACYDLRGRPAASAPLIVLHFAGGADMALPPENYFLPVDGGRRRAASYRRCLGFEAADDGLSVIGNVQQQGFRVVFDVEKERIGFAPKGCTS
ncbi:hypothetical protein OsJ_03278 [Oryza sativa Japonica Group]|uniref:Peptidase A1 domain-containing protein n=1 Tax=Oryza sativa subsp. japonica TaxID=39947 RepID=A2ZXA9_ORYSJ|nr:hypothetical protein OsJ_03278 [Oryza sativa Japonica Group]